MVAEAELKRAAEELSRFLTQPVKVYTGSVLARQDHSVGHKTERLSAEMWVEVTDETLAKIIGRRVQIVAHSLDRVAEQDQLRRDLGVLGPSGG
jgi:predicted regulator of amino acid metabolism with ACT domain